MSNHNEISSFIWNVCDDVLRGLFKQHEYGDFRIINNNPYFSLMKESKTSLGAGIGLIAGIIIGNATDNVGLWIALGLCFGAGIGEVSGKKQKKESKED